MGRNPKLVRYFTPTTRFKAQLKIFESFISEDSGGAGEGGSYRKPCF